GDLPRQLEGASNRFEGATEVADRGQHAAAVGGAEGEAAGLAELGARLLGIVVERERRQPLAAVGVEVALRDDAVSLAAAVAEAAHDRRRLVELLRRLAVGPAALADSR